MTLAMSRNSKRLFLVVVGVFTASMNLYFYVRSDGPTNAAATRWLSEFRQEIVLRLVNAGQETIHNKK